jgi:hypothetical protein
MCTAWWWLYKPEHAVHFHSIKTRTSHYTQWDVSKILIVVQNYKVYFGLYPSSGIYKTKSPVIETSSFQRTQLSRSILPYPPEDEDRSSLRNVVTFCHIYTRRWIKSKINLIVLYSIHYRQNPSKSILRVAVLRWKPEEFINKDIYCF